MPLGTLEELHVWGSHANCYAYAVNCKTPVNGNIGGATPGKQAAFAGKTVPEGLVARVVADGAGSVLEVDGDPKKPPPDIGGQYLIALLAHSSGFHFIRRDSTTGRWSWKDGNSGSVKFNVLDMPDNKFIYIHDEHLNDLLVARRADFFPWAYANMNFVRYFRVANAGATVRGQGS